MLDTKIGFAIPSPSPTELRLTSVGDAFEWAADRLERADLAYGHGTDNAADEAAFLILEGLGLPIDQLRSVIERPITEAERDKIVWLVEQRETTRRPAAYLLGRAYIGPYGFMIDDRALIPRSFIGELLAAAVRTNNSLPFVSSQPVRSVLELGTGSGCLAILAALAFPEAAVDAVDLSADALALAAENIDDYQLSGRIRLLPGDLFEPATDLRYDLIISNPPYVAAASMANLPPEYRHEPELGLAGGADGLDLARRIVTGAGGHLSEKGGLLCEVGAGQQRLSEIYPSIEFLWLDTEGSEGEVFWLEAAALPPR